MRVSKLILTLLAAVVAISCSSSSVKIKITNQSGVDGVVNTVEIPVAALQIDRSSAPYLVVKGADGVEIPSQLTYDDMLIFQMSLAPDQSATVEVSTTEVKPNYASKVSGRLVPERKDDWAWESDKIAFRIYGPALQATGEISNGLDVWVKSTSDLVIDKWYKSGKYHDDHGEGLDYYKVGRSLGAGMLAPLKGKSFDLGLNFLKGETLDNGPIRYTFKVDYAPQQIEGGEVVESRIISLDAGSHFNKITSCFDSAKSFEFPAAIGVISHGKVAKQVGVIAPRVLAYSEPAHKKHGVTHVSVITLDDINEKMVVDKHLAIPVTMKSNTPTTFYSGAGWSKGGFESAESWNDYSIKVQKAIAKPYVVEFVK